MTFHFAGRLFQNAGRKARFLSAFCGALLVGIIAQGMGLFNKFSWHDDIFALFWTGTTIASGRWMLHVVGWLETLVFGDGNFSLPLMSGLFSLLLIAFSACLLTQLFSIRKPVFCFGLGGVMASFPVVTGLFGFMFTMPYYMLAMAMMTLAAYLICRENKWWGKGIAILLGGCSIGIYQAFLPLLLSIPLLYDMTCLSEKEEDLRCWGRRVLTQAFCIMLVMVFYFAMSRFFLAKYDIELNSYMGINQVGSTSLSVYLGRAGRAYREFILPTRNVPADMYPMHVYYLYRVMIAADALAGGWMVIRTWKTQKVRAVLLTILLLLFPLASNFIYVMSEYVHGLMTYSLTAQTLLFAWLMDRLPVHRPALRRGAYGAAAVVLGMTCWMYARFDNQCYLKAAFQQQEAISWYTTLAARIKGAEGYRDDLPVLFLNEENISDQTLYNMDELNFIHLDSYGDTTESYIKSYAWRTFMERWCGFSPAQPAEGFSVDPALTGDMPHYPDDGSIQLVEDVLVVNF